MENDKKHRRLGSGSGRRRNLVKQRIWNTLLEDDNLKKRMIKSFKLFYHKYPFRPADVLIVFAMLSFYGLTLAFWKNLHQESLRTIYPYNYNHLRFWAFFPWLYERQPKEPFLYKPNEENFRDVEMFEEYNNYKNSILFKKNQQYNSVLLSMKERIVPCLDHRELDITEYQTLVKLNNDKAALNMLKKSINEECLTRGITTDNTLYLKETLASDYKASEYKYKDDLYKELYELIKIS